MTTNNQTGDEALSISARHFRIGSAFEQFDGDYHALKSVINAITWIASDQCAKDAKEAERSEAFSIIFGLSSVVENMMEEQLYAAGRNQNRVALESIGAEVSHV